MTPWILSVDFGTTNTMASMTVVEDRVRGMGLNELEITVNLVEVEGAHRLASAVFMNKEGQLVVGTAAENQSVFDLARYEPTPKRRLGEAEVLLGERAMSPVELVAAVLKVVADQACSLQGDTRPAGVRLTHPAVWAGPKLQALAQAAQLAGLSPVAFVPEPVAAALHFATTYPVEERRHIAVYDLGGGTFDAAVLERTATGFEVAGPPGGIDPLGGEDFDHRLFHYVGQARLGETSQAWAKLCDPPDQAWRWNAGKFRSEIRQAKEALSSSAVYELFIPGPNVDAQLSQDELKELIRPDVERSVEALIATIAAAGLAPRDLAAVYLTGGSSRIPLVEELVWKGVGFQPLAIDHPKAAVALGAGRWVGEVAAQDRISGTVNWFHDEQGYGYISVPGSEDVFVDVSAIEGDGPRSLKEGQPVEFELIAGPLGPMASSVRRSRETIRIPDDPRRDDDTAQDVSLRDGISARLERVTEVAKDLKEHVDQAGTRVRMRLKDEVRETRNRAAEWYRDRKDERLNRREEGRRKREELSPGSASPHSYCRKCGTLRLPQAEFCNQCGRRFPG